MANYIIIILFIVVSGHFPRADNKQMHGQIGRCDMRLSRITKDYSSLYSSFMFTFTRTAVLSELPLYPRTASNFCCVKVVDWSRKNCRAAVDEDNSTNQSTNNVAVSRKRLKPSTPGSNQGATVHSLPE